VENRAELVPLGPSRDLELTDAEADALYDLLEKSKAPNTRKAYASDMRSFSAWCAGRGAASLPAAPAAVVLYLRDLADRGRAPSTIKRHLSSISVAHQLAGYVGAANPARNPLVLTALDGLRNELRGHRPTQAAALRMDDLRAIIATIPDDIEGVRDKAIILIGFAGGFRRSEVSQLNREDIAVTTGGFTVYVPWSKTDQAGEGDTIGLPYGSHLATCPVRAWQAWAALADEAGMTAGPAFRDTRWNRINTARLGDRSISTMLARRAAAAGLDGAFSGHSMRAGFATEAFSNGVPEVTVMRHGRWKSSSVMRRYIRDGGMWQDNPAARLGL
jgi:integrase